MSTMKSEIPGEDGVCPCEMDPGLRYTVKPDCMVKAREGQGEFPPAIVHRTNRLTWRERSDDLQSEGIHDH